ncbi:MAG: T9SS type A sorting domain-containing protein [Bacteroidales bacterium]|nr:T9SS type A sorting domain-containing protein [Bacteroidales bacterium]
MDTKYRSIIGGKVTNNKPFFLAILLALLITVQGFSQDLPGNNHPEVYFRFISDEGITKSRLKNISIDKIRGDTIWAYASVERFNELGIKAEVMPVPSKQIVPNMKSNIQLKYVKEWDFYPTYEAYEDLMQEFATTYPDLCKVQTIGTSVEGRDIIMAQISDDLEQTEPEAGFFYTSTMHGDETVGYILLLRLMDYLLSNYGADEEVTKLIDELDIWINPLANPDGTYASGNHTVFGATRFNANGVDLNRNFPDPKDGQHPDGNEWQPETIAFMEFGENHHLTLSANLHTGIEVVNYPWDIWSKRHADNDWWIYVSRQYADTAHLYSASDYMDEFNNGITNGYDWYSISGGRQDYMNYYHHCREFTLELSNTKLPPADELPLYWEWNHRSLLNYMEQCTAGIKGIVTDSLTGQPVRAKILIPDHDKDSSVVFSYLEFGAFYRPIYAGTYDITLKAGGYKEQTLEDITIENQQNIHFNIQLSRAEDYGIPETRGTVFIANPGNSGRLNITSSIHRLREVKVISLCGQLIGSYELEGKHATINLKTVNSGMYICNIHLANGAKVCRKFILAR